MMKMFAKRQQILKDLDAAPPKSLAHLRHLITDELASLGKAVAALEAEFYNGATAMEHTRLLAAPIRQALAAHRLPELSTLRQLETVIRFARDPELTDAASLASAQPNKVSREAADTLLEMQNRLLEFVPGRFSDLIHRTQRLLVLCDKYLCAFYDLGVDPAIETPKLYAANSRIWCDRVRQCVTHLYQLPQLFLRGGLSLARLSPAAIDLLERCEMLACPVLAMFPDCCERLREAGRLLTEWVRQDELYVAYLRNDLSDLEKLRAARERALKKARHRSSMRQYRVKQLWSEKAKLTVELDGLLEKEAELIVDDEALYQEINSLQVDIEIKEFRRDELKRGSADMRRDDLHTMWEALTEDLRRLRMRLPVLRRQQAGAQLKMAWIESKRVEHKNLCNQIDSLETQTWAERRQCNDEQDELEKIVNSIEKCKEIQHLKSSPDVLKKIFFNMPLPTESNQRPNRINDSRVVEAKRLTPAGAHPLPINRSPRGHGYDLERVLAIVGAQVGRDWPRMYRALPFVPPRGDETIDADIRTIEAEFVGDALKERAKRALLRWRRFHTRARVEDVCQAVNSINRQDLVDAIDAFLNPVDPAAKDEEPIPEFLAKDLIPYYREVQKFDRLRAANRI